MTSNFIGFGLRLSFLPLLVAMFFLGSDQARAQRAGRQEANISKMRCYSERTPSFPASAQGNRGSRDDWCRIDLDFDTKTAPNEGWLDEIEIKWAVLADTPGSEGAKLMSVSTFYTDVEDGKHSACVYIKPKFFKRYMKTSRLATNRLSLYAEIVVNGQVLARFENKSSNRVPDGWFRRNPNLVNELLPKRLTPFAVLDYDYYEHEKVIP